MATLQELGVVLNANNLKAALGGGIDEGNAADIGDINGQDRNSKGHGSESASLYSRSAAWH